MTNLKNYLGIDISKDVFDVVDNFSNHYQFENSIKGFKQFLKLLDESSHCVMEATGYYYVKLAYFLLENNQRVSVENPLSIKRFIQMHLSKIKTDKSDARMIRLYAESINPKLWQGQSKNQLECHQILSLISTYKKQQTALKNKIHGENTLGAPSKLVLRSLTRSLKNIHKEIHQLELKLLELVKQEHQRELTLIESVPGIGRKTAIMLLVLTDGFKRFSDAKELCSYSGLTPLIRNSGSSVNGRPRISKMGNASLRNLLFMCSFTASRHNKPCAELYGRITAKGKSKKLALIAVSNKLLKQVFAIVNSGVEFNPNYRSTLALQR